jgi:DeoR/GlpR family transcriptional regulator of sugar metabolism
MTDRTGTPEARHAVIGRVLAEQGRLDVAEVAEQLGVAPETVRRDLKALESIGMLRRVHGGAIPIDAGSRVPIPTLAAPSTHEAAAAARVWAELPRSGTVLIGSGPLALALTHAVMADPPAVTGLTVVTNSLDAAVHLARLSQLCVYNIGGTVSRETGAQEGDWALEELARLRVDVAVLSPTGISADHGLSESTPAAAAVAQAILACSERRLAICASDTLGRNAFVRFGGIDDIHHVFVAGRPEENVVRSLIDKGLTVTVVAGPAGEGERPPAIRRTPTDSLG